MILREVAAPPPTTAETPLARPGIPPVGLRQCTGVDAAPVPTLYPPHVATPAAPPMVFVEICRHLFKGWGGFGAEARECVIITL